MHLSTYMYLVEQTLLISAKIRDVSIGPLKKL